MRRRAPRRVDAAAIDLSAMLDMVFILLIFFIVTTTFTREAGVQVERPESTRAGSVGARFVAIAITREGRIHLADRMIAPTDVATVAAALQAADSDQVVIQADRLAPTGLTLRVQDLCLDAGARQVHVATRRR